MDFDISFQCISNYVCNKICRCPTSPDTKGIDCAHQEHTDICRRELNYVSTETRKCQEPPRTDKSQTPTNADLQSTYYSTLSTKLDTPRRTLPTIRGRRCSRRMAHSDYMWGLGIENTKYFFPPLPPWWVLVFKSQPAEHPQTATTPTDYAINRLHH